MYVAWALKLSQKAVDKVQDKLDRDPNMCLLCSVFSIYSTFRKIRKQRVFSGSIIQSSDICSTDHMHCVRSCEAGKLRCSEEALWNIEALMQVCAQVLHMAHKVLRDKEIEWDWNQLNTSQQHQGKFHRIVKQICGLGLWVPLRTLQCLLGQIWLATMSISSGGQEVSTLSAWGALWMFWCRENGTEARIWNWAQCQIIISGRRRRRII